jgi:hypothetical protein
MSRLDQYVARSRYPITVRWVSYAQAYGIYFGDAPNPSWLCDTLEKAMAAYKRAVEWCEDTKMVDGYMPVTGIGRVP